MPHLMAVSTASVDITPAVGYPMGGYGVDEPRLSDGVNEPLTARCTILWDAGKPKVIVTADVLAFGASMHHTIRSRVTAMGVAWPDFVLTATHTHNGPVLIEKLDPAISYNLLDLTSVLAYCVRLTNALVGLVAAALAAPRTVCSLDYLVTDEAFSYNREGLPYAEVDVPVLVARDLLGAPRAVLFSYGAHPVAANGQTLFDPDYPAQAIKEIEAISPDTFAQFLLGPAGDQNPTAIGTFDTADAFGRDLGATVANAIATPGRPLAGPIDSQYTRVSLPLDTPDTAEALASARAAYLARSLRPGIYGFGRRHAEAIVAEFDAATFASAVDLPVQIWRLQGSPGLSIVLCGGEVVSGYAVTLRSRHGGSEELWFNAYANEIPAYIPSDELLNHPCYAGGIDLDSPAIAGGSMAVYKQCGHFRGKLGPDSPDGVEQILLAEIEAMIQS